MIAKKYFDEAYTILPISIFCELSCCAVEQCLIQLDFKLSHRYKIVVGRDALSFMPKITGGIIEFELELQENLPPSHWYVVDEINKQLIYSVGV